MNFELITPNKRQLNDFAFSNKNNVIFQSGFLLDIYNNVPNCEVISLAAVNSKGNIVATLVGIIFQEYNWPLNYFSSHSTIRGGPLYVDNEEGKRAASFLIKSYLKKTKTKTIYNRIFPMNSGFQDDILFRLGYILEGESNIYIDLTSSEDELWSSMHKMKRKAVSKALKNNLYVKNVESEAELRKFYSLLQETYSKNNLNIRDFKLFENIYLYLVPQNLARILLVFYEDQPIAGRVVLTYDGRIYDWYAGSKSEFLNLRPNDFLVWNIISWGANNGYKLFDFGGAGDPNEEYKVRDFKLKFGGRLENYGKYAYLTRPVMFRICNYSYKKYQKLKSSKQN